MPDTPFHDQFDRFFEAVWGQPPFAWQRALAKQVLSASGDGTPAWPEAIALPTASGKTACIDIAVFALAARVHERPQPPRRIFFVVDRRVIVDEAFDRAQALARALAEATDGVLLDVANRLRRIGGDTPLPLAVHALRGGQLRSDEWASTPLQPTVIASTVDQVGSRLLFRGYGPSQGMWPVHAALVGNDALILLDEAHCAQPMLETLRAVQRYKSWAERPLPAPLEVAVLSATPPADVGRVFRDKSDERRDPTHPLGRRQLAAKPARLVLHDKAKARDAAQRRLQLAATLADQTLQLVQRAAVQGLAAPAVVVFCNRVDTARQVCRLLRLDATDVHLLTGRMRPLDKDDVVSAALAPLASRAAGARQLERPCFIVATQTLEVGADLDFDLLATECASLDALRQRFGRLNRSGRPIAAQAVIVAAAHDVAPGADDYVYGPAIAATWFWLNEQARYAAGDGAVVDFGIAAMEPMLPAADALAVLNAPAKHAPVLLPAHLDALAQTGPATVPSPDVALFLHGPSSGPADVQVCWRADLTSSDVSDWIDVLLRCPPSSPECLSVPLLQARRWLDGQSLAAGADVEGAAEAEAEADIITQTAPRRVLRWRGCDASEMLEGSRCLRPGDLIVVPAALGGFDELGTLGNTPTADWGDRAHALMRSEAVLRLHPDLLKEWPTSAARDAFDGLLGDAGAAAWEEDPAALAADLQAALLASADALDASPRWQWLRSILLRTAGQTSLERKVTWHPCGGWIVTAPPAITPTAPSSEAVATASFFFGDEDDTASSGHFRSLLVEPNRDGNSHLGGVGLLARRYATHCGLESGLVEVIAQAGDGHDLGKADPRFQSWLRNGMLWSGGPLLAKSAEMPQSRADSHAARLRAGYPDGGRHELLSVRLLESCADALPADSDSRDLLLHLVESHHGYCRPFAPVVVDASPLAVSVEAGGHQYSASSATGLEQLDAGPADRYWGLTRRYGWWGLAWLEAVLRLADHRRSEFERRG